jgi:hypothetical protein
MLHTHNANDMKNITPPKLLVLAILCIVAIFWALGLVTSFVVFNLYWLLPRLYLLSWVILLAVHILFAIGVARDATAQKDAGRGTFFVEPAVWGLATLMGGLLTAVVYWVFHHSTLRRD